jgi:hypothetical protein
MVTHVRLPFSLAMVTTLKAVLLFSPVSVKGFIVSYDCLEGLKQCFKFTKFALLFKAYPVRM